MTIVDDVLPGGITSGDAEMVKSVPVVAVLVPITTKGTVTARPETAFKVTVTVVPPAASLTDLAVSRDTDGGASSSCRVTVAAVVAPRVALVGFTSVRVAVSSSASSSTSPTPVSTMLPVRAPAGIVTLVAERV